MADTLYEALNITSNSSDNTIVPGTTPRLVIAIKDEEIMKHTISARIDVSQAGKVILQELNTEIQGTKIAYTFSQEETYQMNPGTVQMQVHGLTDEELAWKTPIFNITIAKTLSRTIIGYNPPKIAEEET